MKLSKKGEYALRALLDLAIAQTVGRARVQASELADNEQLPLKFLEQILKELKRHGYVAADRGKFGGYRLAVPPSELTIGHVVRAIEGPLAPIGCVSQSAYVPCSCPDEDHCGLRMLMLDVRNAIAGILDRYSLADVVEVTLRKMRRDGVPLPFSNPPARANGRRAGTKVAVAAQERHAPGDGMIEQLLEDYSI